MYALVLAGGKGERLRPLTEDRPKPMILLAGRPILEYHLAWLRDNGVSHVLLLCGYRADVIRGYFGDGRAWGLTIDYSLEEQPLGRGGAFKLAFARVPESEELIIGTNGDVLSNQPLAPILRTHRASGAVATVMLTRFVSPYGIVRVARDGRIRRFEEKPRLPHWINAGLYVLSRPFFDLLPDVGDHEDTAFPLLAERGQLRAFHSRAYWRSIDTVKDMTEAAREAAFFAPAAAGPTR
ncbi:MAG: nucleotidyltransferase family protein [Dehalococcoidia bacterium]|nr:nucleotidyltransferase family protein [Dehalococcoidia bacterium]